MNVKKLTPEQQEQELRELNQAIGEHEDFFGQPGVARDTKEIVQGLRAQIEERLGQSGAPNILQARRREVINQMHERVLVGSSGGDPDVDYVCRLTRQTATALEDVAEQASRRDVPADVLAERLVSIVRQYVGQLERTAMRPASAARKDEEA